MANQIKINKMNYIGKSANQINQMTKKKIAGLTPDPEQAWPDLMPGLTWPRIGNCKSANKIRQNTMKSNINYKSNSIEFGKYRLSDDDVWPVDGPTTAGRRDEMTMMSVGGQQLDGEMVSWLVGRYGTVRYVYSIKYQIYQINANQLL